MDQQTSEPPIVDNVLCCKCGYNLRGLRESGRCPECGHSIAKSLLAPRMLAYVYRPWLRKLRLGMIYLIVAHAGLAAMPELGRIAPAIGFLIGICCLGLLCISAQALELEPFVFQSPGDRFLRRWIILSAWMIPLSIPLLLCTGGATAFAIPMALGSLQMAIVLYTGKLSVRIPAQGLLTSARIVACIIPAIWMAACFAAANRVPERVVFSLFELPMLLVIGQLTAFLVKAPNGR